MPLPTPTDLTLLTFEIPQHVLVLMDPHLAPMPDKPHADKIIRWDAQQRDSMWVNMHSWLQWEGGHYVLYVSLNGKPHEGFTPSQVQVFVSPSCLRSHVTQGDALREVAERLGVTAPRVPVPEPPAAIGEQGPMVSRFWLHGYWDGLTGLAAMAVTPIDGFMVAYFDGFRAARLEMEAVTKVTS
jgi:hypothetical protein